MTIKTYDRLIAILESGKDNCNQYPNCGKLLVRFIELNTGKSSGQGFSLPINLFFPNKNPIAFSTLFATLASDFKNEM